MTSEAFATAFASLIEIIQDTHDRVERIEAAVCKQYLTREDIARQYLGCSMSHARRIGPWAWPNNDESDVPGKQVWNRRTCEEWYAIPVETRKAQYFRQVRERRPA